ncbi:MAG: hypothetical protein IPJ41_09340 [Phycisphaerales bacterium]|nr:hypothetical protein [Phycisphaerales bacterium]
MSGTLPGGGGADAERYRNTDGRGRGSRGRPPKPSSFPCSPHRNGQWAKKIRGRFVFFGPWRDPIAARDRYLADKDELHAGLVPRGGAPAAPPAPSADGAGNGAPRPDARDDAATLRDLANHFLTAKQRMMHGGELSRRSFADYHATCSLLLDHLGRHRRLDDITAGTSARSARRLSKGRGPVALNQIQHAHDVQVRVPGRPARLRCGSGSEPEPGKRVMRAGAAGQGDADARAGPNRALAAAGVQMRAMILLGINCGMGNTDVASLPLDALDLDAGILDYPRTKTAIPRRATLWPETAEALRSSIGLRASR